MISVSGLSATRGRKAILQDVSFELKGGVVGLVAPNGSGKTTLLESLARPWDRQVSGHILLNGQSPSPTLWEKKVFYLPTAGEVLEPSLTGRQQAELAIELWGSSAKLEKVAAACGSSEILDISVRKCSEGMRQLVAITVAMCTGAALLLLDEPLSALDPSNTERATGALRKYATSGRTVLMSTHNLANVDASCDEVFYLKGGKLVTADELNQTGKPCLEIYRSLYQKGEEI